MPPVSWADGIRRATTREEPVLSTKIFVNLPVKDLPKAIHFFTEVGYSFDDRFTDETATCMVVSEHIFVMLLVEERFAEFTPRRICDTSSYTEAILALSVDSREAVDDLAGRALAAGATVFHEPQDHGFMYQRSFLDLDGHLWEVFWMDPAALESQSA